MDGLRRAGILTLVVMAALASGKLVAEAEELSLNFPDGQTAVYKHKYTLDFQSDHPELVDPSTEGRGQVRILDYGEWTSVEKLTQIEVEQGETAPSDQIQVTATIVKAESQPILSNLRLSFERFPHTLENFRDRQFTWRVSNSGSVSQFKGEFKAYAVSRAEMVTDFYHLWIPEAYPVLPDHPVSKGDTWTGSRSFEMDYSTIGTSALQTFDVTYKLKAIKEKKGKRLAIIEEKRKLKFRKWLFVKPVSIV